jgi:hypothetical protein
MSVSLGCGTLRTTVTGERVKFTELLINYDLPHAYLGDNDVPILEQLISTALLIREKSGDAVSIIDST